MHAGRRTYFAAFVLAATLAAWIFLSESPETSPVARDRQTRATAAEVKRPSSPNRSAPPAAIALTPAGQLRQETRESPDLKALFDRYVQLPDPSGEISFVLAGIAGECADFMGKPFDEMLKDYRSNMRAGDHPDEVRREAELKRRMGRCEGFEPVGGRDPRRYAIQVLHSEMEKKALDAAYPGAVARAIGSRALGGANALADKMTIHFLSEKVDGDVIVGLRQYLATRIFRSDGRPSLQQEQVTWSTAWTLVGCDFGADCGPSSRLFYMSCVVHGACDLTSIDDALRQQGVSEDTLRTAYALSARMSIGIRTRNWQALGF